MEKVSSGGPRIRKDIIDKVEEYHTVHRQMKMLEKRVKALRAEIEPYMLDKGVDSIYFDESMGRGVALENRKTPLITSRFTCYDVDDLIMVMDPRLASECIVEVVDRDLLEAQILTGKVPRDIEELKRYDISRHFVAK